MPNENSVMCFGEWGSMVHCRTCRHSLSCKTFTKNKGEALKDLKRKRKGRKVRK